MIDMDGIGKRLRALREEGGWTQAQLAQAIGISPGAVSQLERGEVHSMAYPHLRAAARFLRCDMDWLATGEGSRKHRAPITQLSAEAILLADQIDRLDPQQREIVAAMIQQFRK
jgi:transcriptional regulator with XRE-family HTH domain